jgi:uncharacterized membrane protein YfcA
MNYAIYGIIGMLAGVSSGLFGIGGGLIIVPLLVFFTKVSQHTAAGMSLVAMLLPVGAAAVYEYYISGKITKMDIVCGLIIGFGLFLGAYIGARIGVGLSPLTLRRLFAVFMILAALRLLTQPA